MIKSLNPQNISGSVKNALDLITNLEDATKMMQDPMPMIEAVGMGPLAGMLQQFAQAFKEKSKYEKDEEAKKREEELKALEAEAERLLEEAKKASQNPIEA